MVSSLYLHFLEEGFPKYRHSKETEGEEVQVDLIEFMREAISF